MVDIILDSYFLGVVELSIQKNAHSHHSHKAYKLLECYRSIRCSFLKHICWRTSNLILTSSCQVTVTQLSSGNATRSRNFPYPIHTETNLPNSVSKPNFQRTSTVEDIITTNSVSILPADAVGLSERELLLGSPSRWLLMIEKLGSI